MKKRHADPLLRAPRGVALSGTVERPADLPGDEPLETHLYVTHITTLLARVDLSAGPWPKAFTFTDADLAEDALDSGMLRVMATCTTADGTKRVDHRDVPLQADEIWLRPALPAARPAVPTPAVARPVYANTKGSRYDPGMPPVKKK